MAKSDVKEILRELKKELYDSVEANDIMPHLSAWNVISYTDVENVEKKVSHRKCFSTTDIRIQTFSYTRFSRNSVHHGVIWF